VDFLPLAHVDTLSGAPHVAQFSIHHRRSILNIFQMYSKRSRTSGISPSGPLGPK
jgi:hypothetical protein